MDFDWNAWNEQRFDEYGATPEEREAARAVRKFAEEHEEQDWGWSIVANTMELTEIVDEIRRSQVACSVLNALQLFTELADLFGSAERYAL